MTSKYSYRAIGGLGGATALLLAVAAFGDLVLAWTAVANLNLLPEALDSLYPSELSLDLLIGANMARAPVFLLHLGAHGLSAFWLYRASANAHAISDGGLRTSPAWAVGWYFVPIANLWKPYQVLVEIWRASLGGPDWRTQTTPSMVLAWWVFWLANHALEILPHQLSAWLDLPRTDPVTLTMQLGAALTGLVSCLMLMSIVQVVSALQGQRDQAAGF